MVSFDGVSNKFLLLLSSGERSCKLDVRDLEGCYHFEQFS